MCVDLRPHLPDLRDGLLVHDPTVLGLHVRACSGKHRRHLEIGEEHAKIWILTLIAGEFEGERARQARPI